MTLRRSMITALSLLLVLSACSETAHNHDHADHDVITTITLTLVAQGTTDTVTVTWDDPDGAGGQAPTIDTLLLATNTPYIGTIRVFNDAVVPTEELTSTIVNEGDEHEFFFFSSLDGVLMIALDQDANGLPIGQRFGLTTGPAGVGVIGLDLSHYDNPSRKDGQTPSDETDISIEFPTIVN